MRTATTNLLRKYKNSPDILFTQLNKPLRQYFILEYLASLPTFASLALVMEALKAFPSYYAYFSGHFVEVMEKRGKPNEFMWRLPYGCIEEMLAKTFDKWFKELM